MKGIWLENNQLQIRTDIPIPEPPSGEALVRVVRAGICNTDIELLRGYYPYTGILGHEFVGVVEQGFAIARRALRPRGTLVLKSTYAGNLSLDASSLVVDEITLIGSRCGTFAPALHLLATGQVDVKPLIHAHYPLSEGLAAFELAQKRGVLKVLLEMETA